MDRALSSIAQRGLGCGIADGAGGRRGEAGGAGFGLRGGGQAAVEIVALEADQGFGSAIDHGMGDKVAFDERDRGERCWVEVEGAGHADECGAGFGIGHGHILFDG
jgi:hypothetical protein